MSEWGTQDYANNAPKYLNTNHPGNTNLFLVNSGRLANATFGGGKAVAHQGWVKVFQGTGFVQSIAVANVNTSIRYANAYLSIVGANTTKANAQLLVEGPGANQLSIILNAVGAGYNTAPTITATGANNATLVFTVTPGGRMGRVQAETMVALSNPQVSDANSGLPYFPGL
jgi:hypothetical protein